MTLGHAPQHGLFEIHLAGHVPYELVIRTGEVLSEILAAIEAFEVDLIVIPTHGRR